MPASRSIQSVPGDDAGTDADGGPPAEPRVEEQHDFVETRRTEADNEEDAPDILYAWAGQGTATP